MPSELSLVGDVLFSQKNARAESPSVGKRAAKGGTKIQMRNFGSQGMRGEDMHQMH